MVDSVVKGCMRLELLVFRLDLWLQLSHSSPFVVRSNNVYQVFIVLTFLFLEACF